ncbi:MAG: plastocyanin/azurin family copper-binding protein [Nitrososphaerales archaeon]
MLKIVALLAILLVPYALIAINAQEFSVEIAEGSKKVDNGKFYVPARITVPVGSTVVWKNFDDAPHTVTSGTPTCVGQCWGLDFDSGIMRLDEVYRFTFDKAGTYAYLCSLHPWMIGSVTVLAPGQKAPVELTVKVDSSTYNDGDTVVVRGSVSAQIEGISVMIQILNPDNVVVTSDSLSVGNDGSFSYNFKLVGKQIVPGSYTVKVRYSDASAEGMFVVGKGKISGVDSIDGGTDVKVAAKQLRDLLLVRVRNAESSTASIYGISIETSDSVIEAFKGPRNWSDVDVTSSGATASAENEPLNPGGTAVFKLKVTGDDFVINWTAFDSKHNPVDQGEVKPIRR